MKRIVFSFDDSRSDFYTRAFPVLSRYKYPSTLNVITGFVNGNKDISFLSAVKSVTREELVICQQSGLVEIACHGSEHLNTKIDIENNISELNEMGIDTQSIGFASPNSVITWENKNNDGVWDLVDNGTLKYVRSGIQIRREGVVYIMKSIIGKMTHIPALFYSLNKRNVITSNLKNKKFLPSVSIYSYTTVREVEHLIEKMPDNSSVILMFHSILKETDDGYKKDKYYWDLSKLERLCEYLKHNEVMVCTTKDICG